MSNRPRLPQFVAAASPHQARLTSANEGGSPAVRKLLSSVVSELARPVRARDVATAVNHCLPLPDLVTCLNPLCDNKRSGPKAPDGRVHTAAAIADRAHCAPTLD